MQVTNDSSNDYTIYTLRSISYIINQIELLTIKLYFSLARIFQTRIEFRDKMAK